MQRITEQIPESNDQSVGTLGAMKVERHGRATD
jgi:hypothetical protein